MIKYDSISKKIIKTIKNKTIIIILLVASEFVQNMDDLKTQTNNRCQIYENDVNRIQICKIWW
jgi:hypothetical protein